MRYYLASLLNEIWYKYARFVVSYVFFFAAYLLWLVKAKEKSRFLCAASLRYGVVPSALILYKNIIEGFPYKKNDFSDGVGIDEAATRTIVIKWPNLNSGRVEKGILIVTFTRTFSYFLRNIELEVLSRYFHIVLEPSWSGYADPDIIGFVGRLESVIVQSSEIEDRVLLNSFPNTFVPVSFGASDWVDSKLFVNQNVTKIYDSIYIANTNPIKRVRRYLEAIKKIVASGRKDYVGCLVCASWGGAQQLIAEMVAGYELKENIVLKFSLNREQVIESLNQSKVNVLLSYKEGSNRSLFEAIFCNIPVICIQENTGVNKSYINEFTGLLISDLQLEHSLVWIKDNYKIYSPRNWAVENIEPRITTRKLTALINGRYSDSTKDGELEGVLVKTNNPEVSYFEYPGFSHKEYSKQLLKLFESSNTNHIVVDLNENIARNIVRIQESFTVELSKF